MWLVDRRVRSRSRPRGFHRAVAEGSDSGYFAVQSGTGVTMKKWLRRLRGAVLMGVTWAVIWAPIGLLIGAVVDPDGTMDEPWILVGTLPGFLTGVIFSIVLGVAAGRHKLDDLS